MLVWFPVTVTAPLYAQVDDFTGESFFEEEEEAATDTRQPTDWEQAVEAESTGEEAAPETTPPPQASPEPQAAPEPQATPESTPVEETLGGGAQQSDPETFLFGSDEPAATTPAPGGESMVQNAVIEGVQISSEQGAEPHEKVITVYFIFRDKPTSYFYELKHKEKKIVFEFNDTEKGVSPIPSAQEPPIEGFRIEQDKVDVNAQIRGLKPEWHDLVRVSFFMQGIPEINVKDEYSIISFSFTWSTDPDKVKEYMAGGDKKRKILITSITGGLGLAGLGVLAWLKFGPEEPPVTEPEGPLDLSGLPEHPDPYQSHP
jgi:hypothetical protein